ncbi:hypothetical protein KIH23_05205 [Flavobacterium sp. CYK-55]|uniref:hypothetical protein n=1 Tax=Flavobacterium sp. CYK-55 TaxID=2835529 RepID=UPI001BCE6211|nr:hypothetical protein [Flavobacterium sp. CYK-55]MBS7786685.1 hypothetical protein [Flavobacterium sp. CYK-55]
MKRFVLTLLIVIIFTHLSQAQSEAKQTSTAPLVDPVTNCQLRYYYFPNIEAYFDTQKRFYYFKQDGDWITADEIPEGYRGYSIYNKVNIFINDYDDEDPCQFIELHRKKYPYINNDRALKLMLSKK